MYEKRGIAILYPSLSAFILEESKKCGGGYEIFSFY